MDWKKLISSLVSLASSNNLLNGVLLVNHTELVKENAFQFHHAVVWTTIMAAEV